MTSKRLVLIGGGHAHLLALIRIPLFRREDIDVTVVQPAAHHYYSGMAAGMLAGAYQPEELRFDTAAMVTRAGGRFVQGRVATVEPQRQEVVLGDGRRIAYDVLSCNCGSSVADDALPLADASSSHVHVFPVKPIVNLLAARETLLRLGRERSLAVVVVGGGPSSLELSGALWALYRNSPDMLPLQITICAGGRLLPRAAPRARRLAVSSLRRRDIVLRENLRIRQLTDTGVKAQDGTLLPADVVLLATGVRPEPLFVRSGLPCGPDGGLAVDVHLHSPEWPNIFGGGDCIHFLPQPLDKVGVYAVRQNAVLADNLLAACSGKPLRPFQPGGRYLLIYALGDGTGIFCRGPWVFGGTLAYRLKDWIDRRFMRRFHAIAPSSVS